MWNRKILTKRMISYRENLYIGIINSDLEFYTTSIMTSSVMHVIVRYRKEKRSKTRYAPQKGKRHENNEWFI